jgi:putative ABC transport system permease protein
MRDLVPAVVILFRRSLGHWRLFLALLAGATLSAAAMATVALYPDTVRHLGLRHALNEAPPRTLDVAIVSSSTRLSAPEFQRTRAVTSALLDRYLGAYTRASGMYVRSATFYPTAPGEAVEDADDLRPRANLQWLAGVETQLRTVAGTPYGPGQQPPPASPPAVNVWMDRAAAERHGITVGDSFDLHPHWRQVDPIRVTVAGLVEPIDPAHEFWFGRTDRFDLATRWPTYLLFVDEEALLTTVAGYLRDLDGAVETYRYTAPGLIDADNARQVEDLMRGLRNEVQSQLTVTTVQSGLDTTLADYREKLFFTRLPLFALMLQVAGIVVLYLVIASAMAVDRQAGEIALLKSRGARTRQVMAVYVVEGLAIVAFATALGPLLATAGISALGLTPPFEDLSGGDPIDVPFTLWAMAFALGGSLLALGALLWPAYRASALSITRFRQAASRPPVQAAFFRYYLDLAVVAVAAFGFYQLRQRGSMVTERLFGDLTADPVLLATPSLFMLAVALVFLRLFPVLLSGLLWLAGRLRGPTVAVALTRMARAPAQHSRLILLLLLATAVGMFAAGFRATLDRGYEDRAAYRAGAAGRLGDIREPTNLPSAAFTRRIAEATGVADVLPALRMSGYYSPAVFESQGLTLLGIDTGRLPAYAAWREDFGAPSLASLLEPLRRAGVPPPAGVAVPAGARYLGIWVHSPLQAQQTVVGIRLRDSDGGIWEYRLASERPDHPPNSWRFLTADLSRPGTTRPNGSEPLAAERGWRVEGMFVQVPGAPPRQSQQVSIFLDDLQVSSAATLSAGWGTSGFSDGQVIEPFDSVDAYQITRGIDQRNEPGALSRAPAPEGRSGDVARLAFIRGLGGVPLVSFRAGGAPPPLDILVDQRLLARWDLSVGDEISIYANSQYLPVRIAGSFKLFPTYDPRRPERLMVAELDALRDATSRVPGAGSNVYPNEAWLGTEPATPLTRELLQERGIRVDTVDLRSAILAEQQSDPLIAASWEGVLFLCLAAVLMVSALGFLMYSALGAAARSLEFAILRTMGLSNQQVLGVVAVEHLFVIIAGVSAGTLLGFPLSRLMISYMGLSERGAEPLPPLVSVVSWEAVATVYGLLALVVIASVAALASLYSRLAVSRALRMGDL